MSERPAMTAEEHGGGEAVMSDFAWTLDGAKQSVVASENAGVHDRSNYHRGRVAALTVARDAVAARIAAMVQEEAR